MPKKIREMKNGITPLVSIPKDLLIQLYDMANSCDEGNNLRDRIKCETSLFLRMLDNEAWIDVTDEIKWESYRNPLNLTAPRTLQGLYRRFCCVIMSEQGPRSLLKKFKVEAHRETIFVYRLRSDYWV